jgi:hypothetical protein
VPAKLTSSEVRATAKARTAAENSLMRQFADLVDVYDMGYAQKLGQKLLDFSFNRGCSGVACMIPGHKAVTGTKCQGQLIIVQDECLVSTHPESLLLLEISKLTMRLAPG